MKLCQSRKPSGTNDSHAASATAAPTTNHLPSGRGSRTLEVNSVAARVISSHLHQLRRFAGSVRCRLIESLLHPARNAFSPERLLKLTTDELILFAIRDGASALVQLDCAIIQQLLAGAPRLARTLIVRAVPGGDAQALLAD